MEYLINTSNGLYGGQKIEIAESNFFCSGISFQSIKKQNFEKKIKIHGGAPPFCIKIQYFRENLSYKFWFSQFLFDFHKQTHFEIVKASAF